MSETKSEKILAFLVSPELGDGVSPIIVFDRELILNSVRGWLKNAKVGDSIRIKAKMMSETEFNKLLGI